MQRFNDEMERMFEGLGSWQSESRWSPAIELFKKDGRLNVRAELPGLSKDDVTGLHPGAGT